MAHHVLCARPLHYHSFPDHLYWQEKPATPGKELRRPRSCFTRSDNGWAEGLHPVDTFLKNTHEVLGPLHAATAYDRLTRLEFLTPDGRSAEGHLRRGRDRDDGCGEFRAGGRGDPVQLGGSVVLPRWGFMVEGPRLAAFYAKSWSDKRYPEGVLFAIQPADGTNVNQAARLRVFHGFGDPKITWRGTTHEVRREEVIAQGR